MTSTFVVRQLLPFSENLKKRQIKSPKVYIADSGLLHALLNLHDWTDLEGHPKVGASWEGFAMDVVTRELEARPDECYFWGTHGGAELDLLVVRGRRRYGFEFKRTSAPKITRSMREAMKDLRIDHLVVIHAGNATFPLANDICAVALGDFSLASQMSKSATRKK
jgi:hypothetical protein